MTATAIPAQAGFFSSDESERLRTIRLSGDLGKRFGRVHRFVCSDIAGAVRALCLMVPGFSQALYASAGKGVAYSCWIGEENVGEDMLRAPAGADDIRIAPQVTGSGRGGLFQVVLGAALIGAAFLTGGAAVVAGKLAFSGIVGQMAFGMGVAMVLGGVSQLLTKQPQGLTSVESPDNGASYNFNGPVNTTAQGNPLGVLYGEMIVGAATISGDMYSEDQQ
ncbi:phage tail protein [Alcaligenes faecalis]|uniref:tail assembly protein n=1 Tax=Alcaligenes faecalis TaxID=511 RepID=UPI0007502BAE|nr:tail assembly protein [Alcaligenes faecalis]OSZ41368.1 phage tail protein [Alcaligenes faecalis]OSZ47746.1 phage tail protein [Alcaligenes faecalis]OSZ54166.1 phage tail protein [Alcaligenes faecalis]